jgi:hypothetical protein
MISNFSFCNQSFSIPPSFRGSISIIIMYQGYRFWNCQSRHFNINFQCWIISVTASCPGIQIVGYEFWIGDVDVNSHCGGFNTALDTILKQFYPYAWDEFSCMFLVDPNGSLPIGFSTKIALVSIVPPILLTYPSHRSTLGIIILTMLCEQYKSRSWLTHYLLKCVYKLTLLDIVTFMRTLASSACNLFSSLIPWDYL